MSDRLVRVKSWQEFKRLVNELKPESIVYNIEQTGISKEREFTSLRLIIPSKNYYVYVDFPKGDALRETGFPLKRMQREHAALKILTSEPSSKTQFGNLPVYSYWIT